ncbi:MAG TPA: mannose-1-phosphate guanylyltransferase [Phycisphaerae bacterium]|nr:mannose-1-phosphate guanylyltransferase [Phycisphaerae bacterium]
MMRRAVIMAGGAGTRLWPLSRADRPKQLLPLIGGASLLRKSYERLAELLEPEQILIITGAAHLDQVHEQLPELPRENLIGEPCGRDTAAAIGMSAALLHKRDPETVMSVFTADHMIEPVERFVAAVQRGFEAAEQHGDALITFGIKPTWAHTGLGYIHRGRSLGGDLYEVVQFKEKPDAATAQEYLDSGQYYWNSGMFVWRTETILDQLRRHLPDSHEKLVRMADAWDKPDAASLAAQVYPALEKISIDFAVMEKAPRVMAVQMDCNWLDVGSWPSLADVLEPDPAGNVKAAAQTMLMDSRANIIVADGDHLVATIGVSDLIVVHSSDATLICRKQDAEQIKTLVEQLKQTHEGKYQ